MAEKIGRDDQDKWDRKVSVKDLCVSESGALQLVNGRATIPSLRSRILQRFSYASGWGYPYATIGASQERTRPP